MRFLRHTLLPILLAMAWISVSEFLRNQFLFARLWVDHYAARGLTFPAEPMNGALWGVWALVFSALLYTIARKFSFLHTAVIGWIAGFVLMWLVIGNLDVLPFGILWAAVPWSLAEAAGAAWIVSRLGVHKHR